VIDSYSREAAVKLSVGGSILIAGVNSEYPVVRAHRPFMVNNENQEGTNLCAYARLGQRENIGEARRETENVAYCLRCF
jgi:hypothetical protein